MYWKDRVLVQNGCTHIGKLAQFAISKLANAARMVDHVRIRHQKAVHVRPVFIHLRIGGPGHDGAGNVAAPPGEGVDFAAPDAAVESGNDGLRHGFQLLGHHIVGALAVKGAVVVEKHQIFGIQKGKAQIVRQQQTVEILAPAGAEILAGSFPDELFHLVQLPGDGEGKPQFFRDGQIALPYPAKNRLDVFAVSLGAVGLVEQVGDFFILRKTPPGRAGHHVAAARIHSDNIAHFSELSCVRQGTAAEFDHNFSHGIVSSNITES